MAEPLENGNGFQGPSQRIPLKTRADTPEKKAKLESLRLSAFALAERLFRDPDFPADVRKNKVLQNELVEIAARAREFGVHYGGFHVGAVMLGVRQVPKGHNPYIVYFDANTKPTAASPKHCAEQYLCDAIESRKLNISRVLGIVVVAEKHIDDVSGKKLELLTPCKICRDRLFQISQEKPDVLSGKTPVIPARAENPRWRSSPLWIEKLHEIHEEDPHEDI